MHAGGLKRTAEVFSHVCAFNKAKSDETSDPNSALIASYQTQILFTEIHHPYFQSVSSYLYWFQNKSTSVQPVRDETVFLETLIKLII